MSKQFALHYVRYTKPFPPPCPEWREDEKSERERGRGREGRGKGKEERGKKGERKRKGREIER